MITAGYVSPQEKFRNDSMKLSDEDLVKEIAFIMGQRFPNNFDAVKFMRAYGIQVIVENHGVNGPIYTNDR